MTKKETVVVVLSRNYSTGLGVIRSLGRAGYTVDLIASTKKQGSSVITSSSRYVRRYVEVVSPKIQVDTGEELISAVMAYADSDSTVVIFPTDDFTTTVVARHYAQLREYFLMPSMVGDVDLLTAMDKSYQHQLAASYGLATPAQWIVSLREDIAIPEGVTYPCFVKPMQSASGRKEEMRRCDTESELSQHLESIKEYFSDRSVVIQQYLDITKEYDFSGVCLDQEIIIPAVLEKISISRNERGVTMVGRTEPTSVLGDALDSIIAMLRELHFVGMFDFELNMCDGELYFGEINLRSGGPNYSYCISGANLPAIVVQQLTTGTHDREYDNVDFLGKTFVYEKIAWEDYIHSYITRSEMRQYINGSDYTLLADAQDPQPGKIFFRRIRLSAIKHRLLSILGRE